MVQQVLHSVAHLARQQFVGFLSLLALGDVKEDAEHDSIGYVRIVALAPSGNPADIGSRTEFENQSRKQPMTARVAANADLTLSRSAGWIFLDKISKVIFCSSFETSQRSYARSSIVMASVSTFQDHNATPAARVAARRCFSCQTGMVSSEDIPFSSFMGPRGVGTRPILAINPEHRFSFTDALSAELPKSRRSPSPAAVHSPAGTFELRSVCSSVREDRHGC